MKKVKKMWIHMQDLDKRSKEEKIKIKVGKKIILNPEITEEIICQQSRKNIHLQERGIRNIILN